MPRNFDNVHKKLQQAALELFCEHGYGQTTAAEIAARAGVTERTFFRHFGDKRDILFDGEDRLESLLVNAVAEAPAEFNPIEVLRYTFRAVEALFEDNRAFSEPRQRVIAADPALREREAGKMASLTSALALALERRGIEAGLATLGAQTGAAAFGYALSNWFADGKRGLGDHLDTAFDQLRALAVGNSSDAR